MTYHIIPDAADLSAALDIAKQHKAFFEYNDFWHPEVYNDAAKVDELIELYKSADHDISSDTMHGAFLGLDLAALDPVIKNRSTRLLEQSMNIADRLGVKGVVFHTGLIGGLELDYYLEHWLDEATDFWKKQCQNYPNLTVYIENSFERNPEVFVSFMDRMKGVSNIKICFDYGHAILTPTPIERWTKMLSPYIGHMHLNDNDLINDLHQVPGEGKMDFHKWKELVNSNNINCSVLLELNGNENIKRALNYMETL